MFVPTTNIIEIAIVQCHTNYLGKNVSLLQIGSKKEILSLGLLLLHWVQPMVKCGF